MTETPAEQFERYLAEVERTHPPRLPHDGTRFARLDWIMVAMSALLALGLLTFVAWRLLGWPSS